MTTPDDPIDIDLDQAGASTAPAPPTATDPTALTNPAPLTNPAAATDPLAAQFQQWRGFLKRHKAVSAADAEELEDHLRGSVAALEAAGLHPDEAFLVAVKRMGSLDELSREFAREHSERLWKQLVLTGPPTEKRPRGDLWAMLICAIGAVVSVKVPDLFHVPSVWLSSDDRAIGFWAPNLSLFALPWLAAFLAWRRRASPGLIGVLVVLFALGAVAGNVYHLDLESQSFVLTFLHLPLALWFVVGVAYVGDQWRSARRLMDFIRFTGEWFVYMVLMALGGGVLVLFVYGTFNAINVNPERFVLGWLVPGGMVAAVVVAGWLVEAKQGVVEAIAPVLARIFTPLFTAVLLAFLITLAVSARGIDIERDALILFNLLLAIVLFLVLYTISARDPLAPPGIFDRLQLGLVISALAIDALILVEIANRISEWGTTPNKTAALGENIILLVNLAWSAWLMVAFLRRQRPFAALERWQTTYLPVYAAWLWFVVLALPPVFHYR